MTRRKKRVCLGALVVALLALLSAAVFALQGSRGGADGDLSRYDRRHARLEFARTHLPSWLAGRFSIAQRQMKIDSEKRTEISALVESGHFVRVPITVPGLGGQIRQTHERLRHVFKEVEGYWMAEYWTQSNTVVVFCRSEQASRCREVLHEIGQRAALAEPDAAANDGPAPPSASPSVAEGSSRQDK